MNQNLVEVLRFWARWQPAKVAVHCEGVEYTWSELDQRTDELSAGLAAAGVGRGDVVALVTTNCLEFVEVLFATLKVGGTVAPLNIRWTGRELAHPLRDSAAKIIVTEKRFLDRMSVVAEELPEIAIYSRDGGDVLALDTLRSKGSCSPHMDIEPDATAFLVYSSGTTGFPKGALVTHAGVISAGIAKVIPNGLTPDDRLLVTNPLVYTSGCLTKFMETGFMAGAASYLVSEFDPESTLDHIERHKITTMSSVPIIMERMLASPTFDKRDLSSLKRVWIGGAPVSPALLSAWNEQNVPLIQAYGLTEISGACVLILHPDEAWSKAGFAGRPMLFHEVKIARADATTAEVGEVGQVLLRGPAVMKAYLNLPKETASTLVDGWLCTGDLGFVDADGYVKIVDRRNDLIISGGMNIYPAEIERALSGLTNVDELAVIGVADQKWGNVPLMVVPDTSQIDREELALLCQQELADYKRPRAMVSFGGPLPRTLSGKIEKGALRRKFEALPTDAVALSGSRDKAKSGSQPAL
ncbi:class I adenylate-forming enzyme family protein [Gordonia sp. DT30]|uniref:class I adenylate-forming enzyme family protein n=1 Tax=Gordonia sp. DT30 TaxID=3416546 RepID=UPI003CF90B1B